MCYAQGMQSVTASMLGPLVLDLRRLTQRQRATGTLLVVSVLYNVSWASCLTLEVRRAWLDNGVAAGRSGRDSFRRVCMHPIQERICYAIGVIGMPWAHIGQQKASRRQ
jgi:predicted metal-binding membrane protein